jgi:hypothetical protein
MEAIWQSSPTGKAYFCLVKIRTSICRLTYGTIVAKVLITDTMSWKT